MKGNFLSIGAAMCVGATLGGCEPTPNGHMLPPPGQEMPARAPNVFGDPDTNNTVLYLLFNDDLTAYTLQLQRQRIDVLQPRGRQDFASWIASEFPLDDPFEKAQHPNLRENKPQCMPPAVPCAPDESPKDITVSLGPARVVLAIPETSPYRFFGSSLGRGARPIKLTGDVQSRYFGDNGVAREVTYGPRNKGYLITYFAAVPGRDPGGRNFRQPFTIDIIDRDGKRVPFDPVIRNPGRSDSRS